MRDELLERRSEHLNMVGLGVQLLEIVKTLAAKYKVSTTAIYIDHAKMHEWAAYVSIMKDGKAVAYVVLNALRRLVPRAWKSYVEASTSAERVGAIREMRSIYMDIVRILINIGKIPRVPEKFEYEDVTEYFDIDWEKLSEEEKDAITEGARVLIKSRSEKRSESLH